MSWYSTRQLVVEVKVGWRSAVGEGGAPWWGLGRICVWGLKGVGRAAVRTVVRTELEVGLGRGRWAGFVK